jgi:hypothetical protein
MTTAHRPTWTSAKGSSSQGGNLLVEPTRTYSSKDLPGHMNLKQRIDQSLSTKIDFKADLLEREN